MCELLAARGIDAPFQIQSLVIPEALRGGDVLAKSPTGSGKTLAFAIPIAQLVEVDAETPFALVLVPTRELCVQVAEVFVVPVPEESRNWTAPAEGGENSARNARLAVAPVEVNVAEEIPPGLFG